MELFREYFVLWSISNVIAILLLVASIRIPKLARLLFALLFFWACWLNFTTAQSNPAEYLNYAKITPFSWMENFVNGWFKLHTTPMVTLIAIGQGLIAVGLLLKNNILRIACYGAILFFIAITPLGIGAAFPFSIITSVAIYYILKKDDLNYIWHFKQKSK